MNDVKTKVLSTVANIRYLKSQMTMRLNDLESAVCYATNYISQLELELSESEREHNKIWNMALDHSTKIVRESLWMRTGDNNICDQAERAIRSVRRAEQPEINPPEEPEATDTREPAEGVFRSSFEDLNEGFSSLAKGFSCEGDKYEMARFLRKAIIEESGGHWMPNLYRCQKLLNEIKAHPLSLQAEEKTNENQSQMPWMR